MGSAARVSGSFRDPSGFVYRRDGLIHRQVNAAYAADYAHLMESGLYAALVERGWLIPHEELDIRLAFAPEAHRVLLPEQLAFVSHPYEWCFEQWRDAALTTLRIQQLALAHGMSLKDASAFNVQLHRGQATLMDSLSLEIGVPGRPWLAYRQFCQHFLAPLALMSYVDPRLGQMLRVHLDGIPLDLASRLLPWRTRFKLGLGLHLHGQAWMAQRSARAGEAQRRSGTFSPRSFRTLIEHLEQTVLALQPRRRSSLWQNYYATADHYGAEGLAAKAACLKKLLIGLPLETVWDLGANDGRFSRVARTCGAETVVSWDGDENCIGASYQQAVAERDTGLFPLVLDLANPSPASGWDHDERSSLSDRGPACVVLALGLIHHLAIGLGIPLTRIARFLGRLGEYLVVEWVPKTDSQVQRLLVTRPDIFPHYDETQFAADFSGAFQVLRKVSVEGTCRTLYLMRTRSVGAPGGTNGIRG